ncbi:MAG TPA: septation protein SepH [Propionibacteriaceae bacterium]
MRSARPVGLSQDGSTLIVATPTGEELAIAVDDRLHAVLRGDQPRLGQLEIEMDNVLTPRDIQSRIRAGESLEDVARVAGLPADRVERFAAPVLAEREHIALTAMAASVRRRGETSGHRLLRLAVTERLAKRGVDIDSVDWDAFRREDGRWSVSASYSSGESSRQAVFAFDAQGRFSVADNDEARWVIGEQSAARGPQPGRKRPAAEGDADGEPTLDLSDELALVRVIQPPHEGEDLTDPRVDREDDDEDEVQDGPESGEEDAAPTPPRGLHSVPDQEEEAGGQDEDLDDEPSDLDESHRRPPELHAVDLGPSEQDQPNDAEDDRATRDDSEDDERRDPAVVESPLDAPSSMLDGPLVPTSTHGGLSDASAVPETDNTTWAPSLVVDYPVEPSPEPPEESMTADEAQSSEPSRDDSAPDDFQQLEARLEGAVAPDGVAVPEGREGAEIGAGAEGKGAENSGPAQETAEATETVSASESDAANHPAGDTEPADRSEPAQPPARPAAKRKRAAVPSWDEIMFGGPPRPR